MKDFANLTIDIRMYRMSGVGRYLQNLLPEVLPRLHSSKIRLLANPEDIQDQVWAKDCRISITSFPYKIFSADEQLAWAPRSLRNDVDVLWVPQYNVPFLFRGRLVVTVHDVCHLAMPEILGSGLQRWYSRRLFASVAKRAKVIFCVSEFSAGEVSRRLAVDRSRIVVTYPKLVDSWFRKGHERKATPALPYFLAVGNLKKNKNLRRLLAAFDLIKQSVPHKLILVGSKDGFLNSDSGVEKSIDGFDGRVQFTGQISDDELKVYYRSATALVFPSLYEGFGSPLAEAMGQSCPIICSNKSAFPEVAGPAALYFDPTSVQDIAQALLRVANDAELRNKLILEGKKRASFFRASEAAQLTADAINSVCGNS